MAKECVDLNLDRSNELTFQVTIEGDVRTGAKPLVRMVCESNDGLSYAFNGVPTGRDTVTVTAPPMDGKLSEGTYNSYLEIIVEGRRFVPLAFDVNFKKPVTVVSEMKSHRESALPRVTAKRMTLREEYDASRRDGRRRR